MKIMKIYFRMSEIVKCTSAAERRQEMLDSTLAAVKKCQVRFGGRVELATEGNEEVALLCKKFELSLMHGMKVSTPSLGMAVIKNVKDLVSNNFGQTENGGVWRIVRTILNKHEYERYLMLANVSNDTGRGRAWLRSVLNEQSLERYLHMLLGDQIRLKEFYEEWAFMRDQERSSMLPSMAAGLRSIRFALKVDNAELNGEEESILSPTFAASISGFLPSLKPHQATSSQDITPTIAAEATSDQVIDTSKVRTRKKKKARAPAQIVSFDDDSPQPAEEVRVSDSAPATCINSPAELKPYSSLTDPDTPLVTKYNHLIKNKSSPSLLSQSALQEEDHFQFNYDPVHLGKVNDAPDAEEIDFYDSSAGKLEKESNNDEFVSLTPVTNKGIGALFPVNTLNNNSR